ncbi:hypothetical protein [Leeuwenhoekiella blandensis]|uniref:hypothetical protein n=1 Tax=Leeuwenhoekiella blandensis TaxID=360293 RepID=UPI0023544A83|nr:hypothetical protein [Leeuwenhoekiella blandensis]|tara:strand:+ start:2157 stop:2795 length:639 start_codon:yes stop_codon:yes gene_type:complete
MINTTSVYQDAIRLLFILVNGSEELIDETNINIKGIFRGKARLYAMDFWVRYPDYFANELILKYKDTNETRYLNLAEKIFENEEPDLRNIPMIRFLFGAYEKLDNTLAILVSKGLIKQSGKKTNSNIHQLDFLLYEKSFEVIRKAKDEFPILNWYQERTLLINEIAGTRGGTSLKDKQYEQIKYAKTKLGGIIPSIKEEVQNELKSLKSFIQ